MQASSETRTSIRDSAIADSGAQEVPNRLTGKRFEQDQAIRNLFMRVWMVQTACAAGRELWKVWLCLAVFGLAVHFSGGVLARLRGAGGGRRGPLKRCHWLKRPKVEGGAGSASALEAL